jgi:LPXTG-motif cell wall-anchored protein
MKNKKMLIYGGIALAIGAGAFFYFRKKKNDAVDMTSVDSSPLPNPLTKVQNTNSVIESQKTKKPKKRFGLGSNNPNSGTVEEVSVTKDRKPIFAERIQQGVDPRIDEAMKNRDEAQRIRKAKGIGDVRFELEMQGQKLTVRQRLFIAGKQSTATSQEMLDASNTMLNWAKNR